MTEYARAEYVPRKAYGTFAAQANKTTVKENEFVRGVILADATDDVAGTADTSAKIYAYFSNLGNDDPSQFEFLVHSAAKLRLWKCTWDTVAVL